MVHPKMNIVIDMDETVLHYIADVGDPVLEPLGKLVATGDRVYVAHPRDIFQPAGSDVVSDMVAVERPHLQMFLQFCRVHFKRVIFWSAGQRAYVHSNIKHITRWSGPVTAVYVFDDCEVRSDGTLTKPLARLMADFPDMNLSNTFIVDDRATAFLAENPENGILIPPYEPTPMQLLEYETSGEGDPDVALLELIGFFARQGVLDAPDVRALDKAIFGSENAKDIMGQAIIYPSPGDGDCLFTSVSRSLAMQPTLRAQAEERINLRRQTDPYYRKLVAQIGELSTTTNAHLRALVVAGFVEDPARRVTYLQSHIAARDSDPSHSEVRWLEDAYVPETNSYNESEFLRLLMRRDVYWGDGAAIEILAKALGITVRCRSLHPKTQKLRLLHAAEMPHSIGAVDLYRNGEHYDAMIFDFSADDKHAEDAYAADAIA